jgi:hypothetical protein
MRSERELVVFLLEIFILVLDVSLVIELASTCYRSIS